MPTQSNSNRHPGIAIAGIRVSFQSFPGVVSMLADWSLSMRRSIPIAPLTLLILAACVASSAQIKRDVFAYKVSPRAVISIRNQYGRITVTPSSVDRVVATVVHSDAVEILHQQNENRIEMTTGSQVVTGAKADNVDYQVLVPADSSAPPPALSPPKISKGISFSKAPPPPSMPAPSVTLIFISRLLAAPLPCNKSPMDT
jgi:hypothetical protein